MQHQSSLVRKVEVRRDGGIGRPKVGLDEEQVLGLRSLGMKWNKIASLLGVCEDTLYVKRGRTLTKKSRFLTYPMTTWMI